MVFRILNFLLRRGDFVALGRSLRIVRLLSCSTTCVVYHLESRAVRAAYVLMQEWQYGSVQIWKISRSHYICGERLSLVAAVVATGMHVEYHPIESRSCSPTARSLWYLFNTVGYRNLPPGGGDISRLGRPAVNRPTRGIISPALRGRDRFSEQMNSPGIDLAVALAIQDRSTIRAVYLRRTREYYSLWTRKL